jgi:hypothetical protein
MRVWRFVRSYLQNEVKRVMAFGQDAFMQRILKQRSICGR